MASSWRRNRDFDFRVNCPWIPDWYLANPPVLWCHMLLASSTAQLIWREGGADRVWGGGQWTLHTKGYTELSLCVCALYSVCFSFSFPLCVCVGKHACANVHWLIYFFNFYFFFAHRQKIETCKGIHMNFCKMLNHCDNFFCLKGEKETMMMSYFVFSFSGCEMDLRAFETGFTRFTYMIDGERSFLPAILSLILIVCKDSSLIRLLSWNNRFFSFTQTCIYFFNLCEF